MADPPYPDVIPVFPLTGVLLLPGMPLPLHIFEQRYRNMIGDAWDGSRVIGMVQPVVPRQDNHPVPDASTQNPDAFAQNPDAFAQNPDASTQNPDAFAQNPDAFAQNPDASAQNPELYAVGCLGSIAQCRRADDGRYMIVLQGKHRFRISRELPLHRGYRRVAADYSEFANDPFETSRPLESKPILEGFRSFAEAGGMEVNFRALEKIPAIELVNSLAVSLPFGPAEKQALLEAPDPSRRASLLLKLMRINREGAPAPGDRPPTLN